MSNSRTPDRCHRCGELGHRRSGCGVDRTITKGARWRLRQWFAGKCVTCTATMPPGYRTVRCVACRAKYNAQAQARRDRLRMRGLTSRGKPFQCSERERSSSA